MDYTDSAPAQTDAEARTWAQGQDADSFFFTTEKGLPKWSEPKVIDLTVAVLSMGPVALGADHRTWKYRDGWQPDTDVVKHRLVILLGQRYRKPLVGAVEDAVSAVSPWPCIDPGSPDKSVVGFANGVYDTRSGKLLPHDPMRGFVPCLPVDYVPGAGCPHFTQWIREVVAPEDVTLAWGILAYMLLTGNPQQVAVMLIGSGGNGKGTYLRVLRRLLGKGNCAAESLAALTSNRFRMAQLYGKTANICGDIDPTHLRETAAFKLAVGEDLVSAEHKGLPPFNFENYAVPVFSANEVPTTSDTSDGYFRRWIPLEFPRHFEAGGLDEDELYTEVEGIAATALALLPYVLKDKLRPNPVTKEKFEVASDPFRSFFAEACTPGPDLFTSRDDMYGAYKSWADRNGHTPLSARKVYAKLRELRAEETQLDTGPRGFRLQVQRVVTRQPW